MLSPVHCRRRTPRPVSYYALFKWWLLLSQHPGCLRSPTSFRTEHGLGALAGGLGCSPLDDGAYPPPSSCLSLNKGIRSLVPKGSRVGPLSDSVALPPLPTTKTLTLKLFRRERAISTFDDTFNPPHRSSPSFSTLVSSDLQAVLPALHPAHASVTWFRVYRRQLIRPFRTRFRFGSAAERLNLADNGKSPDHYAKGTPSGILPCGSMALRPLVGMWFQVHVPPLIGVLLIFRSRYLVRYRSPGST